MSPTCLAFQDRVHALVDGEIEPGRADALQGHAAACGACRSRLHSARRLAAALSRAAVRPAPAPPADLVARIMSRLPRRRHRTPLWLAVGGTAAAASAATVFIAALARVVSPGGLPPLAPGLRAALDSAGAWLSRFGALFEALGGGPGLHAGGGGGAALPTFLPALALIATGLLGLAAAVTLSAARSPRWTRSATASS